MCSTAFPEGFYGYIVRFPSDHLALLGVALLAPIVVLVFAEVGRYTQLAASTAMQSPRWYGSQLALLYLCSSVLLFVEAPTEAAWAGWLQQACQGVTPACASAVEAIITMHNRLNIASILLGVIVPVIVFAIRELRVTYPRRS